MAAPLGTTKQSVDLGATGAKGSRIRRDPPPAEKQTVVLSRNERDRNAVLVGMAVTTLLLVVILAGFASYSGWSPRTVVIRVTD